MNVPNQQIQLVLTKVLVVGSMAVGVPFFANMDSTDTSDISVITPSEIAAVAKTSFQATQARVTEANAQAVAQFKATNKMVFNFITHELPTISVADGNKMNHRLREVLAKSEIVNPKYAPVLDAIANQFAADAAAAGYAIKILPTDPLNGFPVKRVQVLGSAHKPGRQVASAKIFTSGDFVFDPATEVIQAEINRGASALKNGVPALSFFRSAFDEKSAAVETPVVSASASASSSSKSASAGEVPAQEPAQAALKIAEPTNAAETRAQTSQPTQALAPTAEDPKIVKANEIPAQAQARLAAKHVHQTQTFSAKVHKDLALATAPAYESPKTAPRVAENIPAPRQDDPYSAVNAIINPPVKKHRAVATAVTPLPPKQPTIATHVEEPAPAREVAAVAPPVQGPYKRTTQEQRLLVMCLKANGYKYSQVHTCEKAGGSTACCIPAPCLGVVTGNHSQTTASEQPVYKFHD